MLGRVNVRNKKPEKTSEAAVHFLFEGKFEQQKELLNSFDQKDRERLLYKSKLLDFKGEEDQVLGVEGVGGYSVIYFVGLGKKDEFTLANFKNALANAVRQAWNSRLKTMDAFANIQGQDFYEVGKNIALGYFLGNYQFNKYKSKKEQEKVKPVEELNVYMPLDNSQVGKLQKGLELGEIIAKGTYLTRNLVNEPASHLGPDDMVKEALRIEKESKGKVKVDIFDRKAATKLGMGSYLGVGQGSDREPKFIVLKLKSSSKSPKRIALVGKTIIFDSGGLSLKPADFMEDMKIDMTGGATVLGVFEILVNLSKDEFSRIVGDKEVYGILPACENMPSGKALRPGDVVQAMNGKTIEVLNTDAEGRLTLADGLIYAEKTLKADYIVDLATLTGACMVALGNDLSGLFSNDKEFEGKFATIAGQEGDELWPLPLYKPYLKKMKSDIADLKNIGGGRYGGAITAALFLKEFVEKAKWIHLDIAGPAHRAEEPKGVYGKGATGWGVATLVEFIKSL